MKNRENDRQVFIEKKNQRLGRKKEFKRTQAMIKVNDGKECVKMQKEIQSKFIMDDPRTKARSFLQSTPIISELEDLLNRLVYEKPNDLHGYLANHFLDQSQPPQISTLTFRRLIGPAGEPSIHIDMTIALRNKTEQHHGVTINLSSSKLTNTAVKQLEALVNSTSLRTILTRIELFDQNKIDEILEKFRSEHGEKMNELATTIAAAEAEAANAEAANEAAATTTKTPANKRAAASPGAPKGGAAAAQPSKKGAKDLAPVEIIPDDPEPTTFAGHLLITGLSLTCRLITSEMKETFLYRLFSSSTSNQLSMPLPIIPVLQSGPAYPGKQSLVKYFHLIPTPSMIHNEEWIHKVHNILQFIRDSISTTKGSTLQSSYATDDGCLVVTLDKAEQGFDLLQNAIQNVCGTDEHWFDFALQMSPYETFDYTRGRYEVVAGTVKTAEELVDVYTELLDAYPRCLMLIDPFRYAEKSAMTRLCDRISNRCYITSTDSRRYQSTNHEDDVNSINCHLISFDNAATITEINERLKTFRRFESSSETQEFPLGLFERDHQEVFQSYLADLAVAHGFRFLKLSGFLSLGGQRTSNILQRLALIRDDIEMNDGHRFAWPKTHEFISLRSSNENDETERTVSPPTNKGKEKKKRN